MSIRRAWSQAEDELLAQMVEKHGTKCWSTISQEILSINKLHRSGKQCRDRWLNILDPKLNIRPWTKEEDQKLFNFHDQYGNRWATISKLMDGRCENSTKNHFYSLIRKNFMSFVRAKGENVLCTTIKDLRPQNLSDLYSLNQDHSKFNQPQDSLHNSKPSFFTIPIYLTVEQIKNFLGHNFGENKQKDQLNKRFLLEKVESDCEEDNKLTLKMPQTTQEFLVDDSPVTLPKIPFFKETFGSNDDGYFNSAISTAISPVSINQDESPLSLPSGMGQGKPNFSTYIGRGIPSGPSQELNQQPIYSHAQISQNPANDMQNIHFSLQHPLSFQQKMSYFSYNRVPHSPNSNFNFNQQICHNQFMHTDWKDYMPKVEDFNSLDQEKIISLKNTINCTKQHFKNLIADKKFEIYALMQQELLFLEYVQNLNQQIGCNFY